MGKVTIVVHGGAGSITSYLKEHKKESQAGIEEALHAGYSLLKKGRNAVSAVEAAVMKLEDNPLFNAGRGSALNKKGEVEMDASIMDGKTLKAGAVSIVRNVKNPIFLARRVLMKTKHVLLSGYGALELAKFHHIDLEPESYFITDYQLALFKKISKPETMQKIIKKKLHGTVGAVAMDAKGNLAAATSTGGTSNCLPGRIGDSCIIGAGCYANNEICAVSGTGEGEFLITRVAAHTIAMLMQLKGYSVQEACDYVTQKHKRRQPQGEIGVITIDKKGRIGISYNTNYMRYGFIDTKGKLKVVA